MSRDPVGTDAWIVDGLLHRVGGPALSVPAHGIEKWYQRGLLHRLDGPAYLSVTGVAQFWREGDEITDQVLPWITENGLPHPSQWTTSHRVMYRLMWG